MNIHECGQREKEINLKFFVHTFPCKVEVQLLSS